MLVNYIINDDKLIITGESSDSELGTDEIIFKNKFYRDEDTGIYLVKDELNIIAVGFNVIKIYNIKKLHLTLSHQPIELYIENSKLISMTIDRVISIKEYIDKYDTLKYITIIYNYSNEDELKKYVEEGRINYARVNNIEYNRDIYYKYRMDVESINIYSYINTLPCHILDDIKNIFI